MQKGEGNLKSDLVKQGCYTQAHTHFNASLPTVWPPACEQTQPPVPYFLLPSSFHSDKTKQCCSWIQEISANDEPSLPFLIQFRGICQNQRHPQYSKYQRVFIEGQLDYSNHPKKGREHPEMNASLPMPRHLLLPYQQINWWYSSCNCWLLL